MLCALFSEWFTTSIEVPGLGNPPGLALIHLATLDPMSCTKLKRGTVRWSHNGLGYNKNQATTTSKPRHIRFYIEITEDRYLEGPGR